ncbi:MAG TPA: pyridoxal-dependent decarboxylase, partial [Usitatibacter sp.]
NLEALWIARELRPGTKVVASQQAHYTHRRLSAVLGVDFEAVACDGAGRMDMAALERILAAGNVGTVVATLGTTAIGSVDPLPRILELRERHGFRLHADAAYGGYFVLAANLAENARLAFERIAEADSIVVDPHKHGLQPYGCGCVLFKDPSVGRFYKHDSPYTYFSSSELHLGEISLECSRPGASAVGLWATQRLLPLEKGGEFASMLERSRAAALALFERIRADARFMTAFAPELDIVVWAPRAASAGEASALSRRIFDEAARRNLHLALADLPMEFFAANAGAMRRDRPTVTCLRSVLMKPEHLDWVERIWAIVDAATQAASREAGAHP